MLFKRISMCMKTYVVMFLQGLTLCNKSFLLEENGDCIALVETVFNKLI